MSAKRARNPRLDHQLNRWSSRWGEDIVRRYYLALELRAIAGLSVIVLMIVFVAATALNVPAVASVALVLTFGGAIVLLIVGSVLLVRAGHQVIERYSLPHSARRTFPYNQLNRANGPARFDTWVQRQRDKTMGQR